MPSCRTACWLLLCQLAGIAASTGWMAGMRGRAAALVEASGFMDRVRELLKAAPAVDADETPARAAGGTRYVHLACTADGIRRHREVSPLPGDALITRSGVDIRPAVSGSDLLRRGGAAAGSWKAGNCRARLAQREKKLGWLTLGSVHAESG